MTRSLTRALEELVPPFVAEPRRWDDVLERAAGLEHEPARAGAGLAPPRRRRQRVGLAFALVTLLLLVAAPAFGLHRTLVDFFGAESAPERTIVSFASLDRGAPEGMESGVIAGETRRIMTARFAGAERTLWVAPTREGGFCHEWEEHAGGCDKLGTVPLGVTWAGESFKLVTGYVDLDHVATVEIHLSDGTAARPRVVWVSAPIDAGFFAYEVGGGREAAISSVVALDEAGERVTAESSPRGGAENGVPPDALVEERSAAVRIDTRSGEAVFWAAPTRYGGRCSWLEVAGRPVGFRHCLPAGYEKASGAAFRFFPTHETVLLLGRLGPRYARMELTFADGTRRDYLPKDGHLLAEVAPEELARGVAAVATYDADGRRIFRMSTGEITRSGDPCQAPRPLPRGEPPCS